MDIFWCWTWMILLIVDEWPVGIIASQIKPTHFDFFCSSGFAFLFPPLEWPFLVLGQASIFSMMLILHSSIYLIFIGKNKYLSRSISHNHKFIFVKLGTVRLINWWVFNLWIYKSLFESVSLFISCCQKPLAAAKAKDGKISGGRDQWQRDHKFRRATASLSFRLHSVNVEPSFSISVHQFGCLASCMCVSHEQCLSI